MPHICSCTHNYIFLRDHHVNSRLLNPQKSDKQYMIMKMVKIQEQGLIRLSTAGNAAPMMLQISMSDEDHLPLRGPCARLPPFTIKKLSYCYNNFIILLYSRMLLLQTAASSGRAQLCLAVYSASSEDILEHYDAAGRFADCVHESGRPYFCDGHRAGMTSSLH